MYMKSIYLVMTQTGSMLSRTIKLISRKNYNHISISLNESLDYMYSFGRKKPYNPFIGRFVVESADIGTFLRFKDTVCRVIKVDINDLQYEALCSNIYDMIENKDKYKYNLFGLFLAAFNIHVSFNNKFYCSEFIKYVLNKSDIDVTMIPDIAHPTAFMSLSDGVMYEGLLKDYSKHYVKR